MFGNDFFPTPEHVLDQMLIGINVSGKIVLEPSAGKGNIVTRLQAEGAAEVLAIEKDQELKKILESKCRVIGDDFLQTRSDEISHIHLIMMNPPFSADERHINHAFEIAPPGCTIIALCNLNTIKNPATKEREQLYTTVEQYGTWKDLEDCFSTAERKTNVEVALITIEKPASDYTAEFDGFFLDEDPEEVQSNGIMEYNVVRDLVNRYVAAIKLYDEQILLGTRMNTLLQGYYGEQLAFTCNENGAPKLRNDFKKDLQKAGWKFIFNKMNLERIATKGLREDINRFVEQQQQIPFTMRNIYHMLEIVVATRGQQMDKAILEVFERLTKHHDDNRFRVEGWKSNSHYVVTQKFVLPYMCQPSRWHSSNKIDMNYGQYFDLMEDLVKALCYLTGDNHAQFDYLSNHIRSIGAEYGEPFNWAYFKVRAYKKGTMHFEFDDLNLWGKLNQHIARLLGYPLFEFKTQTKYQQRNTGKAQSSMFN